MLQHNNWIKAGEHFTIKKSISVQQIPEQPNIAVFKSWAVDAKHAFSSSLPLEAERTISVTCWDYWVRRKLHHDFWYNTAITGKAKPMHSLELLFLKVFALLNNVEYPQKY